MTSYSFSSIIPLMQISSDTTHLFSLPATIFYWYLISCLLVLGYRKVKK
ncbi:MAG: hypothetical protein KAI55_02765 [Candidatus Aenigmarchaeota archaeon]|nr:hypothetical protein [Candidatus Aenigmarchaeota archaeon]